MGLFSFIEEAWDDFTGESDRRRQRWRDSLHDNIYETRMKVIGKSHELWSKKEANKFEPVSKEAKELTTARRALLNLQKDLSLEIENVSRKDSKQSGFFDVIKFRKEWATPSLSGFDARRVIDMARQNHPYNYNLYTYVAAQDTFIKAVDRFMHQELKDHKYHLTKWKAFHRDILKIER